MLLAKGLIKLLRFLLLLTLLLDALLSRAALVFPLSMRVPVSFLLRLTLLLLLFNLQVLPLIVRAPMAKVFGPKERDYVDALLLFSVPRLSIKRSILLSKLLTGKW